MANDNMIDLVAKLNVDDSAEQINKTDIPLLQKQLKSINIKCNVTANGLDVKTIQQSINSAIGGNGVKINITPELKKSELTAQAKALEEKFNIAYPKGKTNELRSELEGLVSAYQKAYQAENGYGDKAQQHMADILKFATQYRKEISLTNEDLKYTQDEIKRIKSEQQQLLLSQEQYNALDTYAKNNQTTVKKLMDNAFGVGRWTSNANTYKYDKPYYWGNFAESVNQINPLKDALLDEGDIVQGIKDLADITNRSFSEIDTRLDINGEHYVQWATHVMESVGNVTKMSPFESDYVDINTSEEVQGIDQLTEAFENLNKIEEDAVEQSKYWQQQQELILQKYEKTVAKIEKAKLSVDEVATRKEVTSGEFVNYNERFNDLMSDGITNAGQLKEARDLLSAINNEYQILNAQMTSDLPRNVIENLIQGITKADAQIKTLTIDFEKLNDPPDELTQSFSKLKSLVKDFDFSTNFENDSKDSIEDKIKAYSQVKVALSETKSLLSAYQKEEKKAFREDKQIAIQANRIKTLAANMQAYAAANKRAIESQKQMSSGKSFAEEWVRLSSEMAKGADLTDIELKALSADFRVFGKEAEAAGLKGESTFGKFLNSFKTMSSYITANMVFNAVKRQLNQMIEEVKAVDSAMVEPRKVTTATEYEFQEFAKSATQTGIELGASVSDVINATATFARLGESLPDAEELGRVATLYKNVGDGIDIETASEDIISTMKAFKIETKDAIKLVDKFNEVGNSFAISSGGIGEALKRSASALAAANNDVSESIALITTAK